MTSKDLWHWNGNRIALFIGHLLVLVMCIAYVFYFCLIDILPDKFANQNFQTTSCFVSNKKLTAHGLIFRRYRADFLVSYNVQGMQYNRWVSGNGLNAAFTQNEAQQEEILAQYQVGQNYACWFNPANPQIAVLVKRQEWFSFFPMLLPLLVSAASLYYVLKSVLQLLKFALLVRKNRLNINIASSIKHE